MAWVGAGERGRMGRIRAFQCARKGRKSKHSWASCLLGAFSTADIFHGGRGEFCRPGEILREGFQPTKFRQPVAVGPKTHAQPLACLGLDASNLIQGPAEEMAL